MEIFMPSQVSGFLLSNHPGDYNLRIGGTGFAVGGEAYVNFEEKYSHSTFIRV
jgi:hypothetical protein